MSGALFRFGVGICLAGIYPIGMKLIIGFQGYVAGAIEPASLGVRALKAAAIPQDALCGGRSTTRSRQ
ncbi:hypothetical protein ACFQ3P_41835 [Paraburkholderia sabiae]|uniref:hypothetical protein n=1 Tax=Paraburkholderia sabiae TaxID=273251 RepID=UPI0036277DBA